MRLNKKAVVENALVLSVRQLVRAHVIVPGEINDGTWYWSRRRLSGGDPYLLSAGYEADVEATENSWLRLSYMRHGYPMNLRIRLEATYPHYGGLRWWFRCPLNGSRASKLYLPHDQRSFGSRKAHRLTYRSCQESGRFAALHRFLAARLDMDEALIRAVTKPPRN